MKPSSLCEEGLVRLPPGGPTQVESGHRFFCARECKDFFGALRNRKEERKQLPEMLRRYGELPDKILSEDDLNGLAGSLFQRLDVEQAC